MSTRAIGTAIGTSEATVRREISSASNDPVAEPRTVAREVAAGVSFGTPAPVTGRKVRPTHHQLSRRFSDFLRKQNPSKMTLPAHHSGQKFIGKKKISWM